MNLDQVKGSLKQLTGGAKIMWGDLLDNDSVKESGSNDILIGLIQESYGQEKDILQKDFAKLIQNLKKDSK
jgi:uncharacterized protein YjbJ (UPF0337 family)